MAGPGAHIILGREDAKQLFAQKGDAAVRSYAAALRTSRKLREAHLILECGQAWNPIHRCLTDGTLEPAGGEFPLNHCILGGRRLHQASDFEAVLIRPDIVPFIAESLHILKRTELHEKYFAINPEDYGKPISEPDFDTVWTSLMHIRQLFDDAAVDRSAVLFTVER